MAASGLNAVRVRLYFDYPPPAVSACRMCWLLVDLNKCRVVADLACVIREKFDYSRRVILDLFIEDCYLPPNESVYVVRDNDSIRVKVAKLPDVNGVETSEHTDTRAHKGKKRGREEQKPSALSDTTQESQKKPKHTQLPVSAKIKKTKDKKKEKKQKKEKLNTNVKTPTPKQTITPLKPTPSKSQTDKTSKNTTLSTNDKVANSTRPYLSSDSSDSSEEEAAPRKTLVSGSIPKPTSTKNKTTAPRTQESSSSESSSDDDMTTPAARSTAPSVTPKPCAPTCPKTTSQKQASPSSDSYTSSSSSTSCAKPPTCKAPLPGTASTLVPMAVQSKPATIATGQGKDQSKSSDSDSSGEIKLVIKRPNLRGMGMNVAGTIPLLATDPPGRGRGDQRGRGWEGSRGGSWGGRQRGYGRGRGMPWKQDVPCSYETIGPTNTNDSLVNRSLVLQNPPKPQPMRDYSVLPLLAAPPAVGQKIAFKLLELTENYTPEVSEYKEGKIIEFNQGTKMIELELLSKSQAPAEPGKFDLVYENADGSETVEYAVTHSSQLTERWDSLLEPRLIVENTA